MLNKSRGMSDTYKCRNEIKKCIIKAKYNPSFDLLYHLLAIQKKYGISVFEEAEKGLKYK